MIHAFWILLHNELVVEARDGIEDQEDAIVKESVEEALERIVSEVPFVAAIRVADSLTPGMNQQW
jgi:hypothetical protein